MPADIAEINPLQSKRATFSTALALEKYMRTNYQQAAGDPLPTGHGWPQLRAFLTKQRFGTSEQFAAGYVVLARLNGIPARLVVGFRAPAEPDADGLYTIRDSDAYAWPEVAVEGVGWWPLDPVDQAKTGKTSIAGSTAEITEQARAAVPPVEQIEDPEVPPSADDGGSDRSWTSAIRPGPACVTSARRSDPVPGPTGSKRPSSYGRCSAGKACRSGRRVPARRPLW